MQYPPIRQGLLPLCCSTVSREEHVRDMPGIHAANLRPFHAIVTIADHRFGGILAAICLHDLPLSLFGVRQKFALRLLGIVPGASLGLRATCGRYREQPQKSVRAWCSFASTNSTCILPSRFRTASCSCAPAILQRDARPHIIGEWEIRVLGDQLPEGIHLHAGVLLLYDIGAVVAERPDLVPRLESTRFRQIAPCFLYPAFGHLFLIFVHPPVRYAAAQDVHIRLWGNVFQNARTHLRMFGREDTAGDIIFHLSVPPLFSVWLRAHR